MNDDQLKLIQLELEWNQNVRERAFELLNEVKRLQKIEDRYEMMRYCDCCGCARDGED